MRGSDVKRSPPLSLYEIARRVLSRSMPCLYRVRLSLVLPLCRYFCRTVSDRACSSQRSTHAIQSRDPNVQCPSVNFKGMVHVAQIPFMLRTLGDALLVVPRGFMVAILNAKSRERVSRLGLAPQCNAWFPGIAKYCTATVTEVTKLETQMFCVWNETNSWCDRSILVEIHCRCSGRDALGESLITLRAAEKGACGDTPRFQKEQKSASRYIVKGKFPDHRRVESNTLS